MNKKDIVGFLAMAQFLIAMFLAIFTDLVPETVAGGILFAVPFVLLPTLAHIFLPKDFRIGKRDKE